MVVALDPRMLTALDLALPQWRREVIIGKSKAI
jgi:hypothetical protein